MWILVSGTVVLTLLLVPLVIVGTASGTPSVAAVPLLGAVAFFIVLSAWFARSVRRPPAGMLEAERRESTDHPARRWLLVVAVALAPGLARLTHLAAGEDAVALVVAFVVVLATAMLWQWVDLRLARAGPQARSEPW